MINPKSRRTIEEFLNFDPNNIGYCRRCGMPLAIREDRNLLIVYFPNLNNLKKFFVTIELVNQSAFRCLHCKTRHQFIPYHEKNKLLYA